MYCYIIYNINAQSLFVIKSKNIFKYEPDGNERTTALLSHYCRTIVALLSHYCRTIAPYDTKPYSRRDT